MRYLKSLDVRKGTDWIQAEDGVNHSVYRLSFYCQISSPGCIICADGTTNNMVFFISSSDARRQTSKRIFSSFGFGKEK